MAFNKITFDITQTQFKLNPNEEYTIKLDDGFILDEQYTANLSLGLYTFTTPPVVIDSQLLYVNTKIYGIKLIFDREVNYNNGDIFLYYEDSTLLQTWSAGDLTTTWSLMPNRTEVELYIQTPSELVDRTFFVILEDDVFYSDDRVLTKTGSWADSSIDFQYVGQHLESLVIGNTNVETSISALSVGLDLAPWQYLEDAPNGDLFYQSIDASNTHYILGRYDNLGDNGTVYILDSNRDPLYTLTNPGSADTSYNRFGENVKINETYALIAAPENNSSGTGTRAGEVYVYNLTNGNLQYTLSPTLTGSDNFGRGLSITNDYFIVGSNDLISSFRGRVSVYNVLDGTLAYRLDNPNPDAATADDNYGTYITANDTYLIVSAYTEDDTAVNIADEKRSGKVYIYNIANGTLLRTLNNPNTLGDPFQDFFGWNVAIDSGTSNLLAVGATTEDSTIGTYENIETQDNDGVVYIFDALTGSLIHTIQNPLPNSTSGFGQQIEITTDYIIVKANEMIFWLDKSTYEVKQTRQAGAKFGANTSNILINESTYESGVYTYNTYFLNKI